MGQKFQNKVIYLDYHASTPVDQRVSDKVVKYMVEEYGNPSSVTHIFSDKASEAIEISQKQISELINCDPEEVIFTSGATESVNLAIQGFSNKKDKLRIATLPLEHKAVLTTCKKMRKRRDAELIELKVDNNGRIDLEFLENVCKEGISLICAMAVNNEIGNIYPIEKIGAIAKEYDSQFLCDATQGVGKIPIDFENSNITYLAMSAHKMYGPKGIGALIVKKGHRLEPLFFGGNHQKGIRPGTLNVSGIVGLGECCRLRKLEMENDEIKIKSQKALMLNQLIENFPEIIENGDVTSKISGNLSISIPGIYNQDIIDLVRDKLAISTGSACNSGFEIPSHVLMSMNLPKEQICSTLRIGFGKFTSNEEVEEAAKILIKAIKQLKSK